jgi:glycosyltransferase involved in cell wall biosynthesis
LIVPFLSLQRLCDYASAQRVDYYIANSLTPKERIKKYYRREATVVYPFVDDSILSYKTNELRVPEEDYFLVVTRLNAWKRVDIAVEACRKTGIRVKILGEGPDRRKLETLAGQLGAVAEFLGYVTEQEKINAILGCKALIITQKEDFGIAALEAMSLGKPVIAYGSGGVLETVVEGLTGEFFRSQTADSLVETISHFNEATYKPEDCTKQAGRFSKARFIRELDEYVKKVYDVKHADLLGKAV